MTVLIILLLLPLTLSAQVTLTPMEVRRANVLLDECERVHDELADTRLELRAWQDAFTASETARLLAEAQIADGADLSKLHQEREMVLVNALAKSGRVTKRRERALWIVGTVAVVEAAVIGIAYGLR
jgi:hypothetical protein